MNPSIEDLRVFLQQHPPAYDYKDATSLLDALFYFYTEQNPLETAQINHQFQQLDHLLSTLSIEDNNQMFMLTCSLCTSNAKQAFIYGVQVGYLLFSELFPNATQAV